MSSTAKILVPKIRPVSWRIYVQGKDDVQYVRQVLGRMELDTSDPEPMPTLMDPPVFGFLATAKGDVSLTTEEVAAILDQDDRIEVGFETG